MTSFLAAALDTGGAGVALRCACVRRSWLFPEVFDDCSCVGCRLSSRDTAITRELNETLLLEFSWRLEVLVVLSHVEKCSTPSCPQNWYHQHFAVSIL